MNYWKSVFCILFISSAVCISGAKDSLVQQYIAEGDYYAEKEFNNEKAYARYLEALKLDSTNYNILWRLSRTLIDIGEHLPSSNETERQQQLKIYKQSLTYAQKAIAVNPEGAMGYVRRAIANGRIALFKGVWDALDLVKQTKADCEKAIQLDPVNPTAYYILARMHQKVCEKPKIVRWSIGLGWANIEKAIELYEKAIELRPNFIMYRLDCAKAYIEVGEYQKAREYLTLLQSFPKLDEDDDTLKLEAKELLKKIEKK